MRQQVMQYKRTSYSPSTLETLLFNTSFQRKKTAMETYKEYVGQRSTFPLHFFPPERSISWVEGEQEVEFHCFFIFFLFFPEKKLCVEG